MKRGWCETHYQRWRLTGELGSGEINSPSRPLTERFWSKVQKSDGCWAWTAATNEKGYGMFWNGERAVRAHRFAFEAQHGEIPDGLQIDHLCRNPACCNPNHLEAVTPQENTRRGDAGKHWAEKRGEPVDFARPVAPTIPSRSTGGGGLGTDFNCDGGLIPDVFGTLSDGAHNGGGLNGQDAYTGRILPVSIAFGAQNSAAQGDDVCKEYTAPLTTTKTPAVTNGMAVRRLTPIECERLMGLPDDYTRIPYRNKPAEQCPDGPRYKALGNGWAVNCAQWIGERIALVEAMTAKERAA